MFLGMQVCGPINNASNYCSPIVLRKLLLQRLKICPASKLFSLNGTRHGSKNYILGKGNYASSILKEELEEVVRPNTVFK